MSPAEGARRDPADEPPRVCVFCSSARDVDDEFHDLAAALGRAVAERGWTLVYGGTPTGTMGTLARAASAAGGRVEGVCLAQFVDVGIHDTEADELVVVDSLGERKDEMIRRSAAFVALPGGFGTADELLEVVSQRQLGYHDKPLVVVDHGGFYTPLLAFFELLHARRFAYPATVGAYDAVDDVDTAVRALVHALAPDLPDLP